MKTLPLKHEKGWGYELWIANNDKYCGKVLHFFKGKRFSLHYHVNKMETWYVASGKFSLLCLDPETAKPITWALEEGDSFWLPQGIAHQLFCVEEGDIFEVSTTHEETDSYRISAGDSQKSKVV